MRLFFECTAAEDFLKEEHDMVVKSVRDRDRVCCDAMQQVHLQERMVQCRICWMLKI
jgi:hypothetical protein